MLRNIARLCPSGSYSFLMTLLSYAVCLAVVLCKSLVVYGGYNTVKGGLWRGLGGILLHIHPLDLAINEWYQ